MRNDQLDPRRVEFGKELMQAREKAGMSVESLAQATRISRQFIENLEKGMAAGLPGDVYVRGFVKAIARTVGLDPAAMVARYAECMVDVEPVAPRTGARTVARKAAAVTQQQPVPRETQSLTVAADPDAPLLDAPRQQVGWSRFNVFPGGRQGFFVAAGAALVAVVVVVAWRVQSPAIVEGPETVDAADVGDEPQRDALTSDPGAEGLVARDGSVDDLAPLGGLGETSVDGTDALTSREIVPLEAVANVDAVPAAITQPAVEVSEAVPAVPDEKPVRVAAEAQPEQPKKRKKSPEEVSLVAEKPAEVVAVQPVAAAPEVASVTPPPTTEVDSEESAPATERFEGSTGLTPGGEQVLELKVRETVKIRMAIDSTSPETNELKPDNYRFNFLSRAELLIFDAGAVEIAFNGRTLGALGGSGRVRRLTFSAPESDVDQRNARTEPVVDPPKNM